MCTSAPRNTSIENHHSNSCGNPPPARGPLITSLLILLAACAGLIFAASTVPAHAAEQARAQDPFANGTWHAVKGSWPGTLNFDTKTRKVVLQPMGSSAIHATYAYTVKSPASQHRNPPRVAAREGVLTMTNTLGQVSQADYRIEQDKQLTLSFKSSAGAQVEHYLRMSPAEEEAEKQRIQKMMAEGKFKNLKY